MTVAFANIFMAEFETKLICQSRIKPIEWKRYIGDVFSLWNKSKQDINLFIEQANQFHPSIKFTAEISENEISFLDTIIYKGDRFQTDSILDIKTHYKPTETFQYRHFTSCHPSWCKTKFYQRWSDETPTNKLFTNYFWRVLLKLQTAPLSARIS